MRSQLKPHQQQGHKWMMQREKRTDQLFEEDKQIQKKYRQKEDRQLSQIWEDYKTNERQKPNLYTFAGKLSYEFQDSKWIQEGILAYEQV